MPHAIDRPPERLAAAACNALTPAAIVGCGYKNCAVDVELNLMEPMTLIGDDSLVFFFGRRGAFDILDFAAAHYLHDCRVPSPFHVPVHR